MNTVLTHCKYCYYQLKKKPKIKVLQFFITYDNIYRCLNDREGLFLVGLISGRRTVDFNVKAGSPLLVISINV